MARDETATIFPKPRLTDDMESRLVQAKSDKTRSAPVLDMGEASREEGFRLNGCR